MNDARTTTSVLTRDQRTVDVTINAPEEDDMSSEHLHVVDYPQTIKILTELLDRRNLSGFVQSPSGIDVDWCALKQCGLSTTEKALWRLPTASTSSNVAGDSPAMDQSRE